MEDGGLKGARPMRHAVISISILISDIGPVGPEVDGEQADEE